MRALPSQPSLVERVCEAIVGEIVAGRFALGARLIQDEVARALGVSRQPVQQALLLLRNQGLLKDAPGRGLVVAPLEANAVRDLYQLRGAMEALACTLAASRPRPELSEEGEALVQRGRAALKRGSLADQIAADIAFHGLLARASGNSLLVETMGPLWPRFQRIMAEALREGEQRSRRIWDEHAALLDVIVAGDGAAAERLSRDHLGRASSLVVQRIVEREQASVGGDAEALVS